MGPTTPGWRQVLEKSYQLTRVGWVTTTDMRLVTNLGNRPPIQRRSNAVADTDLQLKINWQKDGRRIDFETEPRFIQTNDNSMVYRNPNPKAKVLEVKMDDGTIQKFSTADDVRKWTICRRVCVVQKLPTQTSTRPRCSQFSKHKNNGAAVFLTL